MRAYSMGSGRAKAQTRWTVSFFMIVLATSVPFVVTRVDLLLLSLNLPVVTQVVVISTPTVPYDPYLEQQGVEVARADYSTGVMITMLIITVVPLVVAALAYFWIPRRGPRTAHVAATGAYETGRPGSHR
jgi:hypothetical protein